MVREHAVWVCDQLLLQAVVNINIAPQWQFMSANSLKCLAQIQKNQGLSFTVLPFVSHCCSTFPSIMAKYANAVVCAQRVVSPNAVFKRSFIVEMLKQQYPWETAAELPGGLDFVWGQNLSLVRKSMGNPCTVCQTQSEKCCSISAMIAYPVFFACDNNWCIAM